MASEWRVSPGCRSAGRQAGGEESGCTCQCQLNVSAKAGSCSGALGGGGLLHRPANTHTRDGLCRQAGGIDY